MKSFAAACVMGLAWLQGTDALNAALGRKLNEMAEFGLLPDGTPMERTESSVSRRITANAYPPETIVEEYVELPLNHFAKGQNYAYDGTFYNRFWVRENAYKPGGPVFLYDVGEADASTGALTRLQNDTNFFKQLVDKYSGIGIVWEHRYYGNSTPEPILITIPPDAFKWLTTEQSLADVKAFADQFKRKNIKHDLTPKKTPWIFIGGSYPGMRAAFMRDKYPETIFAGLASSAPTEARTDMSVYFEPIWRGLNAYGFGNCTRDIQAAVRYMDNVMDNKRKPAEAAKLKEQFLGKGAGSNSDATFGDALTMIFSLWQGYGVDGGSQGLRYLCDHISTDPETKKTSPAAGWAKSKGAKWTVDRWSTWKTFPALVNTFLDTNCSGDVNVQSDDCDLNKRFADPSMISWTWQYCTQWGYFQSSNAGPHQLVSKHNSLKHQRDICHRQFPDATFRQHGFPDWPNTEATNREFGGWDLRPSQTYWSGGEFDPWRTLSPLADEADGAPRVRKFTQAPKCGQEQRRSEIFGYVLPNAQHCFDFRAKSVFPGSEVSRKYFTDALDGWLKCFKPRRG